MAGLGHHRHETSLAATLPHHTINKLETQVIWCTSDLKRLKSTVKSQHCPCCHVLHQALQFNNHTLMITPTMLFTAKLVHVCIPNLTPPKKAPGGIAMRLRMVSRAMTCIHPGTRPTLTVGIHIHSTLYQEVFAKALATTIWPGTSFSAFRIRKATHILRIPTLLNLQNFQCQMNPQ